MSNPIKNLIEIFFNKTNPDDPYERPSFHESFLAIARIWRLRSTCISTKVGACLVKDNKVLATGYNGMPAGIMHCTVEAGINQCHKLIMNIPHGKGDCYRNAVHAEQNCIIQTSFEERKGAILYCTHFPCSSCARLIIQSGIVEVHYIKEYPDENSLELFNKSEVKVFHHNTITLEDV